MEEESSAIPMEQRVELLEARLHEKEQQVEALTQLVQQLALRVERLEKERTQSGPRAHPATPALQKPKALATAARGGSGVGANPHPQIKRETATTNTTASSVRLPSRRASMPTSNKKGATVHKKTPTTAATATATSNGSGSAAQPPKQPQQKPLQKKASSAAGSSGSSPGLKVVDGEAFQYWPLKGKAYYPSHYQVPPPSNNAPPSSELSLQWVHGYRGSDRVNNLQYLNDEEIIYFTAATCVIQNLDKHQQRFFSHQDDILCLALHPSKKIAATGEVGKNGRICIWNTSDMQLITCIENAGSGGVECLAFSQGEQGEEDKDAKRNA
ncbi:Echinoderm microtubule-associated protein-like 6 [Balamuthia mandrillaris]